MSSIQLISILFLSILLIGNSAGAELQLETSPIKLKIGAGDTVTKYLLLEWRGQEKTQVTLETELEAENTDTEGINTTIPQKVTLQPDRKKKIPVRIETSFGLIPDNYSLQVRGRTRAQHSTNTGGSSEETSGSSSMLSGSLQPQIEKKDNNGVVEDDSLNEEESVIEKNKEVFGEKSNTEEKNQSKEEESVRRRFDSTGSFDLLTTTTAGLILTSLGAILAVYTLHYRGLKSLSSSSSDP